MPCWPVKDQGSRGVCSIFAVTAMLEYEYAQLTGRPAMLSGEYINWAKNEYHVARGEADYHDGAFFHWAIYGARDYGVCRTDLMPFRATWSVDDRPQPAPGARWDAGKRWVTKIRWIRANTGTEGITPEQLRQIKRSLGDGHPVAIGGKWISEGELFDSLSPAPPMMRVPVSGRETQAGHSVLAVGYADDPRIAGGGYLIYRNSWGDGFGSGGYAHMPYAYALRCCCDALSVEVGVSLLGL
ncbi:MAG: C1 family peptidase [Rikenellaceae bacterium]|nr:C1 family peptidase [Rikenellaceae bacterium]